MDKIGDLILFSGILVFVFLIKKIAKLAGAISNRTEIEFECVRLVDIAVKMEIKGNLIDAKKIIHEVEKRMDTYKWLRGRDYLNNSLGNSRIWRKKQLRHRPPPKSTGADENAVNNIFN